MRVDSKFWKHLVTLALCLVTLLPAAAFAAPTESLAKVVNRESELLFLPNDAFDELVLTIQGPCDYQYRQVLKEGEAVFKLDETTIDGVYTYYLVRHEAVEPEIAEVLREARKLDDPEIPKILCRAGKLPGPPVSQSEGFRVFQGSIIYDPDKAEDLQKDPSSSLSDLGSPSELTPRGAAPIRRDFVIADDLIVDGSACIGFDCVNGEVFGFDTVRLKENNLRIKFDDTSTAASFPRNDWQLTANDSANGGASKFSIDDISGGRTPFTVEANARSHSLYVDDGGRIGSRTSTPSVEIHTIDGDTPTLRLQQDGSSGFAPQTWDVAGNETNFFVRDVTNGSTLPFRIRPGAPSSSIFIDPDGNVGINTSSPDGRLHVAGNATNEPELFIGSTSGAGVTWRVQGNTATGRLTFTDDSAGARVPFKFDPGADNNLLRVGVAAANTVDITGTLSVTGSVVVDGITVHADYVFAPGYELDSVAEHAAKMWEAGHLPALPPAPQGGTGPVDLISHQMGILEELEKAHIYIEQLHSTIQGQDTTLNSLQMLVLSLQERLAALESGK